MNFGWDTESRETLQEGESWESYRDRAGISVAVLVGEDGGVEVFTSRDDLERLAQRLASAERSVGYNSASWDHPLLDIALGRHVEVPGAVDLWAVLKAALKDTRWPRGAWKLGAVCERTIGQGKTGVGSLAPTLLAEGRWGELVSYCARDAWLVLKLDEFIRTYGFVIDPDGRKLMVGERL